MPELRKDPVTGRWTIMRTARPYRAGEFRPALRPRRPGPCPFCEGHEAETPREVLAYRSGPDAGGDGPGWRVRVVPNRFPALHVEGELERRGHGVYDLMNGIGAHEVVIESPRHDDSLVSLGTSAVEDVFQAYHDRMVDLRRDPRFRSVVVFKTIPGTAGPTIDHSHTHVLATPTVPPDLALELAQARDYFDYRERCLFCDILQQDADEAARVVVESEHVLALVPFAARTPFETWILPRRHAATYEQGTSAERRDLARTVKAVLERVQALLGDAPVGFVLHSAPAAEDAAPSFHWHLELTPATTLPGFQPEGSGFAVNPLVPEDAARFLRDAVG